MDKPFRTIDEQVDLLGFRGLKTDEAAFSILEREGYYSVVNGYKDDFLASTNPDGRYPPPLSHSFCVGKILS